ncbi:MAG: hypothetical protein PHN63_01330 [Candidatus Omnitrophica bacterium]|nr:hypothetical protein [Candidatus Omnitrophota bacterium]
MFNIGFDINDEFFSKRWPTKRGYFITVIVIVFLILTLEILFIQVSSLKIPLPITISLILFALLVHDVLWRLFTGRVIFFFFNKILIAIHPNVLKEYKNLKTALVSLIKPRRIGHWFKIFILPEDLKLEDNKGAEEYLEKNGLNLLIWGESLSGTEAGKDVTKYTVRFSYGFNYPTHNPATKFLLIRDFDELLKERYWKVHKENSLKDISSLGENISEVGLYIIAVCLLTRGNINNGLNILEDLFASLHNDGIKKKLLIYPRIKNHLIALYNILSIVAWKEEKNREKSIALTRKILALDENNYDGHVRMALYEYQEGRITASKRHVKRCRRIDPRHPCTIFDQAFYYILDRNYEKAAATYKKLNNALVDGLVAFEVANFLEEEYLNKKDELGFLFGAGYINIKFVDHKQLGMHQLKKFCKLCEGKNEYIDLCNLAKGTIANYIQ